jgi:uncharacterized protein YraI
VVLVGVLVLAGFVSGPGVASALPLQPAVVRLAVPAESGTTTANLNMRTGPSTGYSVVRVIPRGATVAIVGSSGSWLNVSYAGSTGWSFGNYISISTGGADVARPAPGSIKAIAFDMVAARGWEPSEYTCLDQLWTRESNWNPLARNPSSGAYGIPQALPASKMAVAGADYLTNPVTQMTWGLDYITARYGSPCGAWAHFQQVNWY